MDDRFEGVASQGECYKTIVQPFNSRYIYAPPGVTKKGSQLVYGSTDTALVTTGQLY